MKTTNSKSRASRLLASHARHVIFTVWVALATNVALGATAVVPPASQALTAAVLCEDWKQVVEYLTPITPAEPSSVLRLLKGHACLALNRNNEALCLFWSAQSDGDRYAWNEWAERFGTANPTNAAAQYLRGDALARSGRWDDAVREWNLALTNCGPHALSLNACGVVHATRQKTDEAERCFLRALRSDAALADVYANLGALVMQQKEGARGGRAFFEAALKRSPDYVLALYGRACMNSVLGQFDGCVADLEAAERLNCVGPFARHIQLARSYISEGMDDTTVVVDVQQAAMSLDSKLTSIKRGDLGFMGSKVTEVVRIANDHPELAPKVHQAFSDIKGTDPKLGGLIANKLDRIAASQDAHIRDLSRVRNIQDTYGVAGKIGTETKAVVPGGSSKLGGEVSTFFSRQVDLTRTPQLAVHQGLKDTVLSFKNDLPVNSRADGFKAGMEGAVEDDGQWPYVPIYGLLYDQRPLPATAGNH